MKSNINKGGVYYNQILSPDETWEETLKRENLQIIQLDNSFNKDFNVHNMKAENGKLVTIYKIDMSEQELEKLLENFKNQSMYFL